MVICFNCLCTTSRSVSFLAGNGPVFGLILSILVGLAHGGIKSIANVTEKIVPFMVFIVGNALIIILMNITQVGNVFALIFKGAFAPAAGLGGVIGACTRI